MGLRNRGQKVPVSDSDFIGRKNILEDFATEWAKSVEQAPRFIVNLHGDGGIGKSELLKQFLTRHAATEMVCYLDANFDTLSDPLHLIKRILEKTRWEEKTIKLKETSELVSRYHKLEESAGREEPSSALIKGSSAVLKMGAEEFLPVVGKLAGEGIERGAQMMETFRYAKKSEELRKFRETWQRDIAGSLVKEINEQCREKCKFVLAIDTYEKVPEEVDQWLLKIFLLGCEADIDFDLRLLIAGRAPLKDRDRHWHDAFGGWMLPVAVEPFNLEETANFLSDRRPEVQNREEIETVYRHTRGYPLWLSLWAGSGLAVKEYFSVAHLQKIEERLLEMVKEPRQREWLRRAAFFRRFDQDLLALAIPEDTAAAFDWLTHQSSLVEGKERFWKLYDIPRTILLANFFARSHKTFCQLASPILSFFEQQLEKPCKEWRELKFRLTLSDRDREETLPEMAYYQTLAEGGISEGLLELALRVSDYKYPAAAMISASQEALEDLKVKIPETLQTAEQLLAALNSQVPEEALEELHQRITRLPFSPCQKALLLNRLGGAFRSAGQPEKARARFEESLAIAPDYEDALSNYARLVSEGEPEKAIETIQKILIFNPNHDNAFFWWGYCLNMLGRHKEAIEKYEKALEINPQDAVAYNNWGWSLGELGRHEEAIEKYEKSLEIDPQDAVIYRNWGDSLGELGRHEEAIKKYEKALEINPQDADAYNNWGLSLGKLDHHEEAIEKYEKALEINPQYAAAYFNWGWSLGESGRHEEAIEKYEEAVKIIDPQDAAAFRNWGWSLGKLGRHEEAIKKYEKALEINPQDAVIYRNWGDSLGKSGRHEEAIEKYEKAVEIDPQYAAAFRNWGWSLGKLGRHEEAIEKYEKAVEIAPNDASTWGGVGWGYYAYLKDYPRSIEASQKALEIDPRAVWIRANLDIALLHHGQYDQAKEEYQKTVQRIASGDYSDSEKNKSTRFQTALLVDLYDARKAASGKLLEQIEEIIAWLEKEKEKL